ncbi:hypothetical protein Skr01_29580 [Sphaerisporangium krabiense]|uniref:Transposase n=1 Tax=Sphaerisporangium krabiense TaxID=763782 RepID=A0A7W9DNU5_9ACTN|nr:transposase [Sphaerisporangium krabiense]GII62873.1 hypothetical protein Skr01_29580 [Sphaerisporangium krabiense]
MGVFCGIDWAEHHHDMALVDESGKVIAQRRITESVQGSQQLLDMLAQAGDDPENMIPVAIETTRGLLVVACLRASGRPVFAINPISASRYRERHAVSRKKSDRQDAIVLAGICAPTWPLHRPLPADSQQAQAWRCWPAPSRTPCGGGTAPAMSCARCCASTTRRSFSCSPAKTAG